MKLPSPIDTDERRAPSKLGLGKLEEAQFTTNLKKASNNHAFDPQ